jgi:antitoxin VapB
LSAYAIAYVQEVAAISERRVRLFRNGKNQAVRIPRDFELPGKDAVMWKEGERLIVEPALPKSLLDVLATLTPFDEDLPEITDRRPRAVKL